MARIISLNFDGYWREVNKKFVPAKSGTYLVYVCRYNKQKNKVALDKLIYIGEADNICNRIEDHEKLFKWRRYIPEGSEICFSFAGVKSPDRQRAETALIYYHKPVCNDEYINSFPFEDTTVESTGRCALIPSLITVSRTF